MLADGSLVRPRVSTQGRRCSRRDAGRSWGARVDCGRQKSL